MKYFKIKPSFTSTAEEIEIEKASDHFVWINGRREAKLNSYTAYFLTYNEARTFMIEHYTKILDRAKSCVYLAEKDLQEIMKNFPLSS